MRIMSMSEVVAEESTFVKNVEFAAKSQACSKNISALILMSGLMSASCATLPSKLKVLDPFAELLPLPKRIGAIFHLGSKHPLQSRREFSSE